MLPPDYMNSVQADSFFSLMLWVFKFYFMMGFWVFLNAIFMVSSIWTLLILCRLVGIPWLDGTTKGLINRTKE